jgi:hypothetical protein
LSCKWRMRSTGTLRRSKSKGVSFEPCYCRTGG